LINRSKKEKTVAVAWANREESQVKGKPCVQNGGGEGTGTYTSRLERGKTRITRKGGKGAFGILKMVRARRGKG